MEQDAPPLLRNRQVYPDPGELSRQVAGRFAALVREAVSRRGRARVALAGGSTPKRLYETLATAPFAEQVDWAHVECFFGDERPVPPDHPDSNYRTARQALLEHVPIPDDQVFPLHADPATIQEDAARYADRVRAGVPAGDNGVPCFDLILLGVGDDGHTASLFPGTDILDDRERTAAAVYVPRLDTWRISLTYPVLEQARSLWFLVTGEGKADIMRRIFHEPGARFPVQGIEPRGQVEWHLDRAAAAQLDDG